MRIFLPFLLLCLCALALSACAPARSGTVTYKECQDTRLTPQHIQTLFTESMGKKRRDIKDQYGTPLDMQETQSRTGRHLIIETYAAPDSYTYNQMTPEYNTRTKSYDQVVKKQTAYVCRSVFLTYDRNTETVIATRR